MRAKTLATFFAMSCQHYRVIPNPEACKIEMAVFAFYIYSDCGLGVTAMIVTSLHHTYQVSSCRLEHLTSISSSQAEWS